MRLLPSKNLRNSERRGLARLRGASQHRLRYWAAIERHVVEGGPGDSQVYKVCQRRQLSREGAGEAAVAQHPAASQAEGFVSIGCVPGQRSSGMKSRE